MRTTGPLVAPLEIGKGTIPGSLRGASQIPLPEERNPILPQHPSQHRQALHRAAVAPCTPKGLYLGISNEAH